METENIYGIEQMTRDARTYIALGIEWIRYHNEKMNKSSDAKKEKLIDDMNEYILKAWDKIEFFEKATGMDIFEIIGDLSEDEKEFVAHAKNLREEFISQKTELTKKDKSNIEYMRKLISKIKKAQDKLYQAELKNELEGADKDLENCYKRLGDMFMLYRLKRFIDSFTAEEREFIFCGKKAIIASEYAKEAEKARRFLMRCEKMQEVAQAALDTRMEFVKMENGEETVGEEETSLNDINSGTL